MTTRCSNLPCILRSLRFFCWSWICATSHSFRKVPTIYERELGFATTYLEEEHFLRALALVAVGQVVADGRVIL